MWLCDLLSSQLHNDKPDAHLEAALHSLPLTTSWTNQNSMSVTHSREVITQRGRHRRSRSPSRLRLHCKPRQWEENAGRGEWAKVFPHSHESQICPSGFTTHAALIKSPSGCLPRKQITMIIPNCHPLTVLKHPSIKSPFQLSPPPPNKDLSSSLSCVITPTAPLRSLRAFQSSPCVNCLPQRLEKKANSLTCPDLKAARNTQPLLFGCRIRQKTSSGEGFPELWPPPPTVGQAKWHSGQ